MQKISFFLAILIITSTDVFSMAAQCTSPVIELCTGATALAIGSCIGSGRWGYHMMSNTAAPSCGTAPSGSAWYSFVVTASGNINVTVTLTAGFYTPIVLYSGACAGLTEVGCYYPSPLANPYTGVFTGLSPGSTVYINMAAPGVTGGQT